MELLCLDLLNTMSPYQLSAGPDPLLDAAWRARWAKKRNLPVQVVEQSEAAAALVQLRAQLREVVDRLLSGSLLDEADEQLLNRYLRQDHQTRVIIREDDRYQLRALPIRQDLGWLLAEIVSSFVALMNDPGRIKTCANPDCQWLFYDESRGGTRRWCDDSCGNLMKVRRFRERHRAEGH